MSTLRDWQQLHATEQGTASPYSAGPDNISIITNPFAPDPFPVGYITSANYDNFPATSPYTAGYDNQALSRDPYAAHRANKPADPSSENGTADPSRQVPLPVL